MRKIKKISLSVNHLFHSFLHRQTLLERNGYKLLCINVVKPISERPVLPFEEFSSMLSNSSLIVFIVIWSGYSRQMCEVRDAIDLVTVSTLDRSRRPSCSKLIDLVS